MNDAAQTIELPSALPSASARGSVASVHFSSATVEWATPQEIYDKLDRLYHFTLDPCATHDNHKCPRYYTIKEDGLAQDWSGERVFMNPPYGRKIGRWIKKAYESSKQGALVVCLIPSRTDTAWWHDYCANGEIQFVRGRILFSPTGDRSRRAPFPSVIVIFKPLNEKLTDRSAERQ